MVKCSVVSDNGLGRFTVIESLYSIGEYAFTDEVQKDCSISRLDETVD